MVSFTLPVKDILMSRRSKDNKKNLFDSDGLLVTVCNRDKQHSSSFEDVKASMYRWDLLSKMI